VSAENNFFKTGWFRAAVFGPLVLTAAIFCFILYGYDLIEGTNTKKFIDDVLVSFEVPLITLALIFPFVAVAAANHRSIQSVASIREQRSQNGFSNYYFHREKFEERLQAASEPHKGEKLKVFINGSKLYNLIFKYSSIESVRPEITQGVGLKLTQIIDNIFSDGANAYDIHVSMNNWMGATGIHIMSTSSSTLNKDDYYEAFVLIWQVIIAGMAFGNVKSELNGRYHDEIDALADKVMPILSWIHSNTPQSSKSSK